MKRSGQHALLMSEVLRDPSEYRHKARLGLCASIKSMIYNRALRNMEVQRARHIMLVIFSKGCCLPYSMIRILKRPLSAISGVTIPETLLIAFGGGMVLAEFIGSHSTGFACETPSPSRRSRLYSPLT